MLSRHPLPRPMWDHKIPGGEKEGEGRLIECGEPKGWKCRVIGLDHSKYTPACARWSGRTTPLYILQHRQGDWVGPHHFPCWDPKTYQLDQTYGIQGKVGDKEGGGVAIRVDKLYFLSDRQSTPNHDISKFKVSTPLGNRTRDLMICRLVC